MNLRSTRDILGQIGLEEPDLNALRPTRDNYRACLVQPLGDLVVTDSGVKHGNPIEARRMFEALLEDVSTDQVDLVVTPEYSMPLCTLKGALEAGTAPPRGCLWVLGCEAFSVSELRQFVDSVGPNVKVVHEPIPPNETRFLNAVAYVFSASQSTDPNRDQLVTIFQFKNYPLGDQRNFELDHMYQGNDVFRFNAESIDRIRLSTIVCSDAFSFEEHARLVSNQSLLIHIQLNNSPMHPQFRRYRERLFGTTSDGTELIALNWAQGTQLHTNDSLIRLDGYPGSGWYTNSQGFDLGETDLTRDHQTGLYYHWVHSIRSHVQFMHSSPIAFLVNATKVVHIGVPQSTSRRRGPHALGAKGWDSGAGEWVTVQSPLVSGFEEVAERCGSASARMLDLARDNPFDVERILALASGSISARRDWYALNELESCCANAEETSFRTTVCLSTSDEAKRSRNRKAHCIARICTLLDQAPPKCVAGLGEFEFTWNPAEPHVNIRFGDSHGATAIALEGGVSGDDAKKIKMRVTHRIYESGMTTEEQTLACKRLCVWQQRDCGSSELVGEYDYVDFSNTNSTSPVDIGKEQ